jgi:hypothetical protein
MTSEELEQLIRTAGDIGHYNAGDAEYEAFEKVCELARQDVQPKPATGGAIGKLREALSAIVSEAIAGNGIATQVAEARAALDELARETEQAATDYFRIAEALGVLHEQSMGPLLPGRLAEVLGAIETLKLRLWSEQTLVRKMDADYGASRTGIMDLQGELHEHLKLLVRYLEEETSQGDGGIREEHFDGYIAAKSALVRTAKSATAWEDARDEVQKLLAKASEVPGLSATLDEARFRIAELETQLDLAGCDWSVGRKPLYDRAVAAEERVAQLESQLSAQPKALEFQFGAAPRTRLLWVFEGELGPNGDYLTDHEPVAWLPLSALPPIPTKGETDG